MQVDPREAVAQLGYWMWDTVDFLSVLDQLREHNSTHAQKIRIYGADVQRTKGAGTYVLDRRAELGLTTSDAFLLAALEDETSPRRHRPARLDRHPLLPARGSPHT